MTKMQSIVDNLDTLTVNELAEMFPEEVKAWEHDFLTQDPTAAIDSNAEAIHKIKSSLIDAPCVIEDKAEKEKLIDEATTKTMLKIDEEASAGTPENVQKWKVNHMKELDELFEP